MTTPLKTDSRYRIDDTTNIFSPGLVLFPELIRHNIDEMIRISGSPGRLCPHCKTHKTVEVTRLMLDAGITHHKCATIAEAEMLAGAGVTNILIAYQLVGPNVGRLLRLMDKFPSVRFATLVDHPDVLELLSSEVSGAGHEFELLLDLDSGMCRTGIEPGPEAIELYETMATSPGVRETGLHWYDGHNRQADPADRKIAVEATWSRLTTFRNQLMMTGLLISRIVTGGSGSFGFIAELGEPDIQLSPGTVTLHDGLLAELFPEMNFIPAQALLTRVVSNQRGGFLTLDAGHKSCAADQPAGRRFDWPDFPDGEEAHQTEEHVVLKTLRANEYQPGDAVLCIPRHACPTSAVHKAATIVEKGKVTGTWEIAGRDRQLSI